jgi:isocitrate dehydrogenase (NAD+)
LSYVVTLLAGDGIGPEVVGAARRVLEATGVPFEWDERPVGLGALEHAGSPLPRETIESILLNRVALKGPTTTPVGTGHASANVRLRKELGLYANLRPVRSLPGVTSRYRDVHLIVVRENTEGLYSGVEHEIVPGVVEAIKVITREASARIARFALEYARRRGHRKVTAVHKANIMKLSDGLFLECAREVAGGFPDVEFEDMIVDAACMRLVLDPNRFKILLLENLYGDIVSDLCAGLVGGLGLVPGANLGDELAVFEAVHGSAPDIAGRGVANPVATVLSGAMLLRHLGRETEAEAVIGAVMAAVRDPGNHTRDLGGTADTARITDAIVRELERGAARETRREGPRG